MTRFGFLLRHAYLWLFTSYFALKAYSQTSCTTDLCENGFCDLIDNEPVCSCVVGYDGDFCEVKVEAEDYSDLTCENGVVTWIDAEVTACACDDGWSGDTCEEEIEDWNVCTDVECNGQGDCVVTEEDEALCYCNDGYYGDLCEHEASACGYEYLQDVAVSVYDFDTNSGLDCSFFIALLWTDMSTNNFTGYPGLCGCIDILLTNLTSWADNFGCVVEEAFPMALYAESQMHCNHCTGSEIREMKAVIQNVSVPCDMFITYREEMPLYWRTPMKCQCLGSLGATRDEVAEYVYCPFTTHAARTDLICYDNCYNDDVLMCDFSYVKHSLEIHLQERNPSMLETCTDAMIDMFEMIPGGGFFAALPDDWCPCYEAIATYWSDGLDVLDCHPVTFYEFTIKDMFLLYCNDEVFQNKDDLWRVAKVSTMAGWYDYRVASTCSNFVVYGTALTENATDASILRAQTLFCGCYRGLDLIANEYGYNTTDEDIEGSWWNTFVPDDFADGISELEDLMSLFPNQLADLEYSDCDDDSIEEVELTEKGAGVKGIGEYFSFSSDSTTNNFIKVNISLGVLCGLLIITNSYYFFIVVDQEEAKMAASIGS